MELRGALRKGEERAALESLEQWLDQNLCPTGSCPIQILELVADLTCAACQGGADSSAVAAVGVEFVRLFLGRPSGREIREPLREATRQWVALVQAGPPVSEEIRRALRYLHAHYTSPDLTRKEVAQAAWTSVSHLSQVFHQEMGMMYKEYLTKLRIEEAQRLLEDPSLALEEVAEKVGYRTLPSFLRAFKRRVGMTPGQYRRMLMEGG